MERSPSSDGRFRRVFTAYEAAMRRYCHRRLGPASAEDAVAEIFVVAWRKIDTLPDGAARRLWLYGVARNIVRNFERGTRRRRRLAAKAGEMKEPPAKTPESVLIRRSEDQLVIDALALLKPDDRELLRLRVWEEFSREDLAVVFGISVEAIDMRLSRAKKRMAKALRRVGHPTTERTWPRVAKQGGGR